MATLDTEAQTLTLLERPSPKDAGRVQ